MQRMRRMYRSTVVRSSALPDYSSKDTWIYEDQVTLFSRGGFDFIGTSLEFLISSTKGILINPLYQNQQQWPNPGNL